MCGGAQQVLEMTTAYAKIRIAFGRPIGSYQGVKHRAADMLVDVENAKSLTYYAAWAVEEGLSEAPLAVSMAIAYASDAYRKVAGAIVIERGGKPGWKRWIGKIISTRCAWSPPPRLSSRTPS